MSFLFRSLFGRKTNFTLDPFASLPVRPKRCFCSRCRNLFIKPSLYRLSYPGDLERFALPVAMALSKFAPQLFGSNKDKEEDPRFRMYQIYKGVLF
mmetsp:Transcript_14043/g.22394  ORF Transcript_14043/g.22394 Transcript_14043/m.22394 type:complete len:96 (+) Transcript_14043:1665-1952(+)